MREFNDFEKAVITAFVEARKTKDILNLCVANYIMDATGCYAIEWITDTGYEKIEFYCKDKNAPMSVMFGALDILSLLKYLEDNGYMLVTQKANAKQLPKQLYSHKKYIYEDGEYWIKMGENGKGVILGSKQFLFTDAALLLDRYANAIIYPTTELELYVQRGFKTEDDVKFEAQQNGTKQSIRIARWGIAIAILIGLLGLLATYLSIKAPISLNQEQYKNIIENVQSNTIPETINVKVVNDTLDVNIKKSVRLNTRSHITNIPTPQ